MTVVAREWEVGVCSLYLRGLGGGAHRSRWLLVAQALREAACSGPESASEALRVAGFAEEASRVSCHARWRQAEELLLSGRAVTGLASGAPTVWRRRLRESAPPALWSFGPLVPGPFVAIVGSRAPQAGDAEAISVAAEGAARLGWSVISGGAKGVDTLARDAALSAGASVLEVLPTGLPAQMAGSGLSLQPPGSPFGTGAAMERNALIYAAAQAAVVVRPRYRSGGTWHGAHEALRRNLCPVLVLEDPDSIAVRALLALGAVSFQPEEGLEACLARVNPLQGSFSSADASFWPAEGSSPGTIRV